MSRTILVLAANPKGTSRLRLDQEIREIENGLERSKRRDEFILKQKWAVRPADVRRAMLDHKPNIVHYCGHGAGGHGIALEDEHGRAKLVSGDALAEFFKLFAATVECIVLNACYTEVQAKAIANHIPYVVGVDKAIGDQAAIEFAVAFYDALGAGQSVEFAYQLACNAIQVAGLGGSFTPVLNPRSQLVKSPRQALDRSAQAKQPTGVQGPTHDSILQTLGLSVESWTDTHKDTLRKIAEKYASQVDDRSIFFLSDIDQKRLAGAYTGYANAAVIRGETPLCLYDRSVRRNGTSGCLITDGSVHYRNDHQSFGSVALSDVSSVQAHEFFLSRRLVINRVVTIEWRIASANSVKQVALMILELARELHASAQD